MVENLAAQLRNEGFKLKFEKINKQMVCEVDKDGIQIWSGNLGSANGAGATIINKINSQTGKGKEFKE